MKKARKGFTLVELLIVVAILGVLSVSMMMSVGGTTAKAKAAMIAANFDAARTAAAAYYAAHIGDAGLISVDAGTVVSDSLSNWADLKAGNSITYSAGGKLNDTPSKWEISADFKNDPSYLDIAKALSSYKGITVGTDSKDATMNITPK